MRWAADILETRDEDLDADAANQLSIEFSSELWYRLLLNFTERVFNVGLATSPDPEVSTARQEVWNMQIYNLPGVSEFLVYAPTSSLTYYASSGAKIWNGSYLALELDRKSLEFHAGMDSISVLYGVSVAEKLQRI